MTNLLLLSTSELKLRQRTVRMAISIAIDFNSPRIVEEYRFELAMVERELERRQSELEVEK